MTPDGWTDGHRTENATYRGTSYRSAQKKEAEAELGQPQLKLKLKHVIAY